VGGATEAEIGLFALASEQRARQHLQRRRQGSQHVRAPGRTLPPMPPPLALSLLLSLSLGGFGVLAGPPLPQPRLPLPLHQQPPAAAARQQRSSSPLLWTSSVRPMLLCAPCLCLCLLDGPTPCLRASRLRLVSALRTCVPCRTD